MLNIKSITEIPFKKKLFFLTSNKNKVRMLEGILGWPLPISTISLEEIQSMDPYAVATHKVKQAWSKLHYPTLVWDQSVNICCLNGFPGPLIKWFWKTVSLDKICQIAAKFDNFSIQSMTLFAYYDGIAIRFFSEIIRGRIPEDPMGVNGFAWDPIFIPDGHEKTLAQMNELEKKELSMHSKAVNGLKRFLE